MHPADSLVEKLLTELLKVRQVVGPSPAVGSPAYKERAEYKRPESVQTAFTHGSVAVESAGDHLFALDLLINSSQSALAPWTCARGLLEAAALARWLLDVNINAEERVGRSMALRYATLREQRKLAQEDSDASIVTVIDHRLEEIATIASDLGYQPINDKNGNRISIGRQKPKITDLVGQQLDAKSIYRILSGVAHCDQSTVRQLGFAPVGPSPSGGIVMESVVSHKVQQQLRSKAIDIYAHAVWPHIVQFGVDLVAAANVLENAYSACGFRDDESVRFWRRTQSS